MLLLILLVKFSHVINKYKWYSTELWTFIHAAMQYHFCIGGIPWLKRQELGNYPDFALCNIIFHCAIKMILHSTKCNITILFEHTRKLPSMEYSVFPTVTVGGFRLGAFFSHSSVSFAAVFVALLNNSTLYDSRHSVLKGSPDLSTQYSILIDAVYVAVEVPK